MHSSIDEIKYENLKFTLLWLIKFDRKKLSIEKTEHSKLMELNEYNTKGKYSSLIRLCIQTHKLIRLFLNNLKQPCTMKLNANIQKFMQLSLMNLKYNSNIRISKD